MQGPYRIQAATLNVFAKVDEEDGFYAACEALQHDGDQEILIEPE